MSEDWVELFGDDVAVPPSSRYSAAWSLQPLRSADVGGVGGWHGGPDDAARRKPPAAAGSSDDPGWVDRGDEAMTECEHLRLKTGLGPEWVCADCGETYPQPCQHQRINNETWQCVQCGERMINREDKTETVLSAPNAAPCRAPEHLAAMEAGEDFECSHPYVPDLSRQRVVPIAVHVTYECERCRNNGTVMTSHEPVVWDCGHSHRGDSIPVRAATGLGKP